MFVKGGWIWYGAEGSIWQLSWEQSIFLTSRVAQNSVKYVNKQLIIKLNIFYLYTLCKGIWFYASRCTLPFSCSTGGIKWEKLRGSRKSWIGRKTVHIEGKACQYQDPAKFYHLLEEPSYMLDYVSDENGKITGICFDKVNEDDFSWQSVLSGTYRSRVQI